LQLLGVVCFSEICAQDVFVGVRRGLKSSLQDLQKKQKKKAPRSSSCLLRVLQQNHPCTHPSEETKPAIKTACAHG
jgi:hypothetical protein